MISGLRRIPTSPVALVLAAAVTLSLAILIKTTAVRAVLEFPLALLVPGSSFLLAVHGRESDRDFAPSVALAVLLSIAFYPLLALVIYAIGITLSTSSVVIGTDAFAVALLAVAMLREHRVSRAGTAPNIGATPRPVLRGARGPFLLAVALALAGLALGLSIRILPKGTPGYTQFHLAHGLQHLRRPLIVQPGGRTVVVPLSIANHSGTTHAYLLLSSVDRAQAWRQIRPTVAPGGIWSGLVSGPVPADGCLHHISIALQQVGAPSSTGTLSLWAQSSAPRGKKCS